MPADVLDILDVEARLPYPVPAGHERQRLELHNAEVLPGIPTGVGPRWQDARQPEGT
ncbi:hypothetical protein ACFY00_37380 [Kitasatospora sp. NPDC001540]|uniref:hypothetical protein n=1 Tax=Kitasatospora sp. NPDC001540 TaxID=3364014 RepID=UPI003689D438